MKYILLVVLFSVSLFSQPKIMIDGGEIYDWGQLVHSEEPLKTKIKILNIGNDTLIITSVKPGCGCTTAPLDKTVIEPRGFATMDVTLNMPGNAGRFSKNIDIFSNDTLEPKKVVWLKLEVIFPISFFPQKGVKLGTMALNAENTGKVIIKNTTNQKVFIKQLEFEPADLKLNIKNDDFIPPKGDLILEVKYIPTIMGQFTGKITFKTTEASTPRVELPISGVTY